MYMTYSSKVHSDDAEQIGIQADLKLQNWTTAAPMAPQSRLGLQMIRSISRFQSSVCRTAGGAVYN